MCYKIDPEKCVSCAACEPECPKEAIYQGDKSFVINCDKCIECGTCAAVCPMEAVYLE